MLSMIVEEGRFTLTSGLGAEHTVHQTRPHLAEPRAGYLALPHAQAVSESDSDRPADPDRPVSLQGRAWARRHAAGDQGWPCPAGVPANKALGEIATLQAATHAVLSVSAQISRQASRPEHHAGARPGQPRMAAYSLHSGNIKHTQGKMQPPWNCIPANLQLDPNEPLKVNLPIPGCQGWTACRIHVADGLLIHRLDVAAEVAGLTSHEFTSLRDS